MRYLVHDFAGYSFPAQLCRELAAKGHHVTFAYSTGLPGPKGRLASSASDSERFRLHPIALSGHFRKYSPWRRFLTQRKYAQDLKKLISQEQPDVVLSGDTPIDIQAELLWHCRRNEIGFVHWVQDVYCLALEFFLRLRIGLPLAKLLSVPFRMLEKLVAASSDHTIVISPNFADLFTAWGVSNSRISVIENWAPLDELPQMPRQNSWRQAQSLGDKPILLYSGTLGLKHRPDLLYLLAKKLGNQCQVVVLTEGVGREQLEKMPPLDNLTLLGFQPYERLPEVLASADVLLATLEADAGAFAVPSKILTYLCAGRPLLLAGPKENLAASVVERSGAGLVVDPGDASAWVDAAQKLVSNPEYRDQLAIKARDYANRSFDIVTIGEQFMAVMVSAHDRRSKPNRSAATLPAEIQN
jgi:colanic acid biosynthesis glycosyl transferase WcaI